MGFRRHVRSGPAIRITPLPLGSLTLSTVLHIGFIVGVILAVHSLAGEKSQTYVVNLVPAIPAMGSPRGQATPVPRALELPPRAPAKAESRDLPSAEIGLPGSP